MSEHEYMAEVRICPLCEMAANRTPWRDVEGKIAFQCQNAHPTFLEDIPAKVVKKAVVDAAPTRDAVVEFAIPEADESADPDKGAAKKSKR